PAPAPVTAAEAALAGAALARMGEEVIEVVPDLRHVVGMQDRKEASADQLERRKPQDAHDGRALVVDRPLGIQQENRVEPSLADGPEPPLAQPPLFFGALPVADIGRQSDHALALACLI